MPLARFSKGIDHAANEIFLQVLDSDGNLSDSVCVADRRARGGDAVKVNPDGLRWGPSPPFLPKGAKFAVLYADPSKAGPFCIRLVTSVGYRIQVHWHPQAEALTVISGTFNLGMGDKMDATAADASKAGGFHYLPPKDTTSPSRSLHPSSR